MTYLLDTDTCITHLRTRGRHPVSVHLRSVPVGEIGLPSIVVSELLFGGFRSRNPQALPEAQTFCAGFAWLPFDAAAAQRHAQLRADLERRNARIGPYDSITAAIALANNLTLVTHNTGEFSRISGLRIIDWYIP